MSGFTPVSSVGAILRVSASGSRSPAGATSRFTAPLATASSTSPTIRS